MNNQIVFQNHANMSAEPSLLERIDMTLKECAVVVPKVLSGVLKEEMKVEEESGGKCVSLTYYRFTGLTWTEKAATYGAAWALNVLNGKGETV